MEEQTAQHLGQVIPPPLVGIRADGEAFLHRAFAAVKPAGRLVFHQTMAVALGLHYRQNTIGAEELRRLVVELYGEPLAARIVN